MKLVIVSGRSGSVKSTALHILEDAGFYCIDNLPAGLLPSLTQQVTLDSESNPQLAVSIDARNTIGDLSEFPTTYNQLADAGISCEILYLDARDSALIKRFSETRRKHPLSDQHTDLKEAIAQERRLLDPIARLADLTIDTSEMSLHQLRDMVKQRVVGRGSASMSLLFQSFGFKKGIPVDADLVFDVRCLPNPYWKPALRSQTGLDQDVIEFLQSEQEVVRMLDDISDYLEKWLPSFANTNRSYMTVAIGCTGGQHRSVFISEALRKRFKDKLDAVQIRHRELGIPTAPKH